MGLKEKLGTLKETLVSMDRTRLLFGIILFITLGLTFYNTVQIHNIASGSAAGAQKQAKKPSDYKFGVKYEDAIKSKKPMALLFYADWCRFCIGFMPEYEKLYKQYKKKFNFVKINVEDPKYVDLVRKYNIEGFPTLFLVNPKTDDYVHVDNSDFTSKAQMTLIFNHFYDNNK